MNEQTKLVYELLCSISLVLRTLTEGLAKRVDNVNPAVWKEAPIRHEKMRIKYLEQIHSGYSEYYPGNKDDNINTNDAYMTLKVVQNKTDDNDESKDGLSFKEELLVYNSCKSKLQAVLDEIAKEETKDIIVEKKSDLESNKIKLEALRNEATEKNRKIKYLIDKLRCLKQDLASLETN